MSVLDPIGAIFSFTATYFCVRGHSLTWPFTLLATFSSGWLFYSAGIYGDVGLQVAYAIMAIYGWYNWQNQKAGQTIRGIEFLSLVDRLRWMLVLSGVIPATVWFLQHMLHSTVPYLDAITTVLSLLAQWFTSRKIIEAWVLWFGVDILCISLYHIKNMPCHAVLAAVYTIMAIVGFRHWLQIYRLEQHSTTTDEPPLLSQA